MKLRMAVLLSAMLTGMAWAQNPDVIQDTRSTLQNIQKKQVLDQNKVLAAAGSSSPTSPAKASGSSAVAQSSAKSATPATSASKAATTRHTAKVSARAAATDSKSKASAETSKPEPAPAVAVEDKKSPVEPKKETKTYTAAGRRDPFVSPVVSRSMVSAGCSSGKRCLAINQIALTGIVKSDSGMIAVVVNAMNKAYFLRENDPVFNGYVVKITGDSIVFQETVQDNLGKPVTREVTKRISTPAV